MKILLKIKILPVVFFPVLIVMLVFCPRSIFCGSWLKADITGDEKIWIDTSHWENKKVWVEDGYYKDVHKKKWMDTSYTVNQGYWKTENYREWVESHKTVPYTAKKWVDTSHWEYRYRNVKKWVPVNLTIYVETSSYGWSVYSFAAKSKGKVTISYKGNRYHARKWVIDYKPVYGGRVYAVKYECYEKETSVKERYKVWVDSGYWQSYEAYKTVDTSHWETGTRKVWVDTSYKVESGYWDYCTEKEWVDTSHNEFVAVWVEDGFYSSPLHGELTVEKSPGYIFTKWHEDADGNECQMFLNISWKVDNSMLLPDEEEKVITGLYVYEDVFRYKNMGTEKVVIFESSVEPSEEGSISSTIKFDHSGNEDSILHIYLFAEGGEKAHVYFSNPVNGFRSVNLSPAGSSSDANKWLGGNSTGKVEF
ncbi:MAG: hypothetical protein JW770_04860 [Actinobacteria bacterium]|nr:hypothetical protein [Actinomycetota bacterium]